MAFSKSELSQYLETLEHELWTKRRPPLELRDKIREGQRISGHSIFLFYQRPAFQRPGEFAESSIAKIRYNRTRNVWQIYWQRADLKYHRYDPHPEAATLSEALAAIDADPHGCFFG